MGFVFFKQKTSYDVRISDWSSDVCSSDLAASPRSVDRLRHHAKIGLHRLPAAGEAFARFLFADRGHDDHILAMPPVDGGGDLVPGGKLAGIEQSSEERRVGTGCVSTCSSRWSPEH